MRLPCTKFAGEILSPRKSLQLALGKRDPRNHASSTQDVKAPRLMVVRIYLHLHSHCLSVGIDKAFYLALARETYEPSAITASRYILAVGNAEYRQCANRKAAVVECA